jgi:hypothetical protein
MISVRSRKAKGRKLQQWVRDELLKVFPSLNNNDVQSAIMGESGQDIKLSNVAKESIKYSIECKNKQTFKGIYDIMEQAQSNAEDKQIPLAIIKMNKLQPLAIVDASHFIKLIGEQNG